MKITVRRPSLQRNEIASRVPIRIERTGLPLVRATQAVARAPMVRTVAVPPAAAQSNFLPDPYVDYARILTPQGGIAMIYKDLDLRLRHTLLRLFLWTSATSLEGWLLFRHRPPLDPWLAIACLLVVAIINWLIVSKPVEIYRSIEIRPDCMILEGADVFWLGKMEGGWPSFKPDAEGNQLLCGIYGTRFVEYLTVRRFDELDRTPEVLAGHLQDAMRQLWNWSRQA